MADVENLCRDAWRFSSGNPPYDELIESYKDMLKTRAERVIAEKTAPDGEDIFSRFERNVLELVVPERFHQPNPKPIPVEVKAELVEEAVEEAKPKRKPRAATLRVAKSVAKKVVVKKAAKKAEPKKVVKKSTQKGAKKR